MATSAFKSLIKFGGSTFWGIHKFHSFFHYAAATTCGIDSYAPLQRRSRHSQWALSCNNNSRQKEILFVIFGAHFHCIRLPRAVDIGIYTKKKLEMNLFVAITCVHCSEDEKK